MNKTGATLYLVILLLLIIVGIQQCELRKKPYYIDNSVTVIDTFWTKTDTEYVSVPKIVYQSVPGPDRIARIVDTIATDSLRKELYNNLTNYYTKNVYNDTIKQDSNFIYLSDTISENKLLSRSYSLHFNNPIITRTTINNISSRKLKVFVGGGLEFNQTFKQMNLGILIQPWSDKVVINTYTGLSNTAQPSIGASVYWKLTLKK